MSFNTETRNERLGNRLLQTHLTQKHYFAVKLPIHS